MNELDFNQMESIQGGQVRYSGSNSNYSNNLTEASAADYLSCGLGVLGVGIAFVGLVTATGGLGLIVAGIGFSVAPAAAGLSCMNLRRR